MEVKVKLGKLVQFKGAANSILASQEKMPVKFLYAVSRTLSMIEPALSSFYKLSEIPQGIYDYEAKRVPLAERYAKKNEDGTPMKIMAPNGRGQVYDMDEENRAGFDEELGKLREEYKVVLDQMKDNQEKQQEMMEMDVDVDIHGLKITDFPETLTANLLDSLSFMIIPEKEVSPASAMHVVESDGSSKGKGEKENK